MGALGEAIKGKTKEVAGEATGNDELHEAGQQQEAHAEKEQEKHSAAKTGDSFNTTEEQPEGAGEFGDGQEGDAGDTPEGAPHRVVGVND